MTAPTVQRSVRTLGHRVEPPPLFFPCVVRDCERSALYATTTRFGSLTAYRGADRVPRHLRIRYVCRRHAESFSKRFDVKIPEAS